MTRYTVAINGARYSTHARTGREAIARIACALGLSGPFDAAATPSNLHPYTTGRD